MPDQLTAQLPSQHAARHLLFISRRKNRNVHFLYALCGVGVGAVGNAAECQQMGIM
jgi:hypothetical protein